MGSYDVVGSFPKSFGYGVEGPDMEEGFSSDEKPRILLMGLRRSGKSSIQKVSCYGVNRVYSWNYFQMRDRFPGC